MAPSLRAAPSSATSRGDATVQPTYFTSSLFIDTLRADVQTLARIFEEDFVNATFNLSVSDPSTRLDDHQVKPVALFRHAWMRLDWQWLHLKILEPRAREAFLRLVFRVFLDCVTATESFAMRTTGLFGLYMFYMTQPSTSTPEVYGIPGIPVPLDTYETLSNFPSSLEGVEEIVRPHAICMLQTLRPRFLILPHTKLYAQNPRILPREIASYMSELSEVKEATAKHKRAGRPSKAEKAQWMRAAVLGLDRWLEESAYPLTGTSFVLDPAGAAGRLGSCSWSETDSDASTETTHIILSQRPIVSLNSYRGKKVDAMRALEGEGEEALDRASNRVLARLREIDAMAAERGFEVGTEGGELSGIERAENAARMRHLLSLLEAGGLY